MGFMRRSRGSDSLYGGAILGTIVGLLVASSSISWIQSIVTTVTNIFPSFQYNSYIVFGLIVMIAGYINDKY